MEGKNNQEGPWSYNRVECEIGLVKRNGIYENVPGAPNLARYRYIILHSILTATL